MAEESDIRIVEAAIEGLKSEAPALASDLAARQLAAATGLEYYGITKTAFERFLNEESLSPANARRLQSAVEAVRRLFTA